MSNINKLAENLVNLKIKEVQDLIKILENEYKIKPINNSSFIEEKDNKKNKNIEKEKKLFNVLIKSFGESKLSVIKTVKEITGLGLRESKDLVDNIPKNIKENVSKSEAESIKKKMENVGAEIDII